MAWHVSERWTGLLCGPRKHVSLTWLRDPGNRLTTSLRWLCYLRLPSPSSPYTGYCEVPIPVVEIEAAIGRQANLTRLRTRSLVYRIYSGPSDTMDDLFRDSCHRIGIAEGELFVRVAELKGLSPHGVEIWKGGLAFRYLRLSPPSRPSPASGLRCKMQGYVPDLCVPPTRSTDRSVPMSCIHDRSGLPLPRLVQCSLSLRGPFRGELQRIRAADVRYICRRAIASLDVKEKPPATVRLRSIIPSFRVLRPVTNFPTIFCERLG